MSKLGLSIIVAILLFAIGFYIFNNPDGIGPGLDQGATHLNQKIVNATQ